MNGWQSIFFNLLCSVDAAVIGDELIVGVVVDAAVAAVARMMTIAHMVGVWVTTAKVVLNCLALDGGTATAAKRSITRNRKRGRRW